MSDAQARKEKTVSGVAAVLMHAAFFALLVFGVSWQKSPQEVATTVDLWSTLPPAKTEPAPAPEPKPEARPEPPPPPPKAKPEPKAEPVKPPPKPEPKATVKPDIALKEKLEKERKEKAKLEQDKKAKDEQAKREKAEKDKADAKKREEDKAREQREAEAKRVANERAEAEKKLAAAQAAAARALNDKYVGIIQNHVKRFIVEPPHLQGNPQVEFDVVLIPGGEVLNVKLRRSSGVPAYDEAVERAIRKASPLPLPPDPTLFQQFRELHLRMRPKE